jgi:hypothetical protein
VLILNINYKKSSSFPAAFGAEKKEKIMKFLMELKRKNGRYNIFFK